jgi:hypothetical protein
MGLITCPICNNPVSQAAPTCPTCGHPIAPPPRKSSAPVVNVRSSAGGIGVVFLVLCLVGVIVAVVTKPSEASLRNALLEKYGLLYGAGAVAEKFGVLNFKYSDYFVCSTLSVNLVTQPDQTIAYGFFGKTVIPNVPLSMNSANPTSSRSVEPSSVPVSQPETANPPPDQPVIRRDEQNNPQTATVPTSIPAPQENPSTPPPANQIGNLRGEMLNASVAAARQKHPASNFVGNGCSELTFEFVNATGNATQYVGIYRCTMKGAVLGLSQYDFRVRVAGEMHFQNGSFGNRITSSQVIN